MNAKIYYTSVILNIVMLGGTARILIENADRIEKGGEVGNGIGCTKIFKEEWTFGSRWWIWNERVGGSPTNVLRITTGPMPKVMKRHDDSDMVFSKLDQCAI